MENPPQLTGLKKGEKRMKEEYSAPSFDITEFCTDDIITVSFEPTTNDVSGPIELPDINI